MKPHFLKPHPALRPYIKNYLYFEVGANGQWTRADTSPTALPVMSFAMGTDQFIFKEFGRRESLMFCGQLTEYKQMHGFGRVKMFYVFFRPAGAYQLLGVPLKELKDSIWNLRDVLDVTARILKEKLIEQTTVAGVQEIVEAFFLRRLSKLKQKEAAIRLVHAIDQMRLNCNESNIIKRICNQQGYSVSRLERHMQQIVGITPKMLQRIVRFNKVLEYLNRRHPPYHWAEIAREFGYYDQTHFIKDFAWFYGTTPGNLEAFASKLQLSLDFSGEVDSGKSLFRAYE